MVPIDIAGDDFLAGAIFAQYQHIGIGGRDPLDHVVDGLHGTAFTDQSGVGSGRQNLFLA
ncbi:MAG: hypothetical protein RQ899_09675 [Pseudomonadales bacterium]|nr:hypothetical protein [Pseudomonadales bacterium]